MDISALVHHDGEAVLPRRSLSNISAPSPSTSTATIPTPSKPTPTRRQMPLKRKRHDPKPIWAYREGEQLSPELQRQEEERQQSRPPPPPPTVQPQPTQVHRPPPPAAHRNGPAPNGHSVHAPAIPGRELSGFERPVSNDAVVYDEVVRHVSNFIWKQAVANELLRNATAESELTQLEVEARWGHIIDRNTNSRLRGYHDTETVIKPQSIELKFESTMTMEQHKKMNTYLNQQVSHSHQPGAARPPINYTHTKEVDTIYDLGNEQLAILPEAAKRLILKMGSRQKIRVTRDQKTNQVIRSMIKLRVANLEISSPLTEWDYRIGINVEINYPGPIDNLEPVVEQGKTVDSMKRQKDRMSYSWLGAYQVDLTQVQQGPIKNHELELELDSNVLLENADYTAKTGELAKYESVIAGMMNNLRVLSREITTSV